jgi:hypothetical protein
VDDGAADDRREEREPELLDRLRAENAALRDELERMRARYEAPIEPPAPTKAATAKEPGRFALVGPGPKQSEAGPPAQTWDAVGATLCRILEARRSESSWSYYRDVRLVPEGMTFFYAHEALRRMWGTTTPADADPPEPKAHRRLTAAERDEQDSVLQSALRRIDKTLERSEALHAEGHEVAAVGLLKYVDLLLARFNLALARAEAGNADWREELSDQDRDAEVEAWVAAKVGAD